MAVHGHKKIWATEYGQPAFIHTIADYGHDFPDQATMGLFREDWTPKPVVAVVTQVIAENHAINAAGALSV